MEHMVAPGITNVFQYHHEGRKQLVDDEQLYEITGRNYAQWFELLDEAGAQLWGKSRLVRWLKGKDVSNTYWVEAVAHAYGQQHADVRVPKNITIRRVKTIAAPLITVWSYIDDEEMRRNWLDCELREFRRVKEKKVVFILSDFSRLSLSLSQPIKIKDDLTRVTLSHTRLFDDRYVDETSLFWDACLVRLVDVCSM